VSAINDAVHMKGRVALATYPILPAYKDLTDHEVLALLKNETPIATTSGDNILCVAGLNVMIQAINWAAVEDQNTTMGSPFAQTFLAPIVAEVGTGGPGEFDPPPADTDTGLFDPSGNPSAVVPVGAAGTTNASAGIDGYIAWSFLFGARPTYDGWETQSDPPLVTEAGVWVQSVAGSPTGSPPTYGVSGYMLDHSVFTGITWTVWTQLLTLVVTFSFGNS